MLAVAVIFFALGALSTSAIVLLPGAVRARAWLGLPADLLALVVAGLVTTLVTGEQTEAEQLAVAGMVANLALRLLLRRWSFVAAQLFVLLLLSSVTYLLYVVVLAAYDPLGPVAWAGSALLTLLEAFALGLGLSYAFEILDVLSSRDRPTHAADPAYQPAVALQVPTYNEPVEVVRQTLLWLARLEYPRLLVQVVDNNTEDPLLWRPLEEICQQLGPRFTFLHLAPWPGYKAGALNEATRRLPADIELVGIVDADYEVRPSWIRAAVGHFSDPRVAFVQTPQHYRDWQDDPYLRGLFYSYKYFFDVTMPARSHRNAIIFAGTMGLIRRAVLDEIGGWNPETVTEDAEASLRMLGAGYIGVYDPAPYGQGLMPLTFDGLKKQRFRWALGGVQILRMHWREMLPLAPGQRLHLTAAQRLHYLLGSVQWFGDLLTATFTILLLITAAAAALHHRLPVREITGPVIIVPIVFLVSGLARALWALRVTSAASWGDAARALRVWFALAWVVSLACLRGLISRQAAFLRTPKRKAGRATLLHALRSSLVESTLAGLSLAAAAAILVVTLEPATVVLAALLVYLAIVYSSAPWASAAAEGIKLTPFRREYLRSPKSTGERPALVSPRALVPAGLVAAAATTAVVLLLAAPAVQPPSGGSQNLPPVVQPSPTRPPVQIGTVNTPTPTPATPAPTSRPSQMPAPALSPLPTTSSRPAGTATPTASPS